MHRLKRKVKVKLQKEDLVFNMFEEKAIAFFIKGFGQYLKRNQVEGSCRENAAS